MVELIPKQQKVTLPRWMTVLFYGSLGAFVLVLAVFGILTLLVGATESDLQATKAAIEQEQTVERRQLEAELTGYAKKITDFSKLLALHYDTRRFFAELEMNTHPRVWFSETKIDFDKLTVRLSGKAESFSALGQQLAIFEQSPFFRNMNLSAVSLSREGEVRFSVDFSFDPKLFQQQSTQQ
jgi:Tfp pilus assembly protein PilN